MPLLLLLLGAAGPILAGAFVVRRRPRNPVGWLLVLQGVGFGAVLAAAGPHDRGSGLVADQLLSGAWVLLFAGVATAAYLVPDGRPASSFWRRWMLAGVAGMVLLVVAAPGDQTGFAAVHGGREPPVPWLPEPVSAVLGGIGLLGVVGLLVGAVASVVARLRGAVGDERQQLLWLVAGVLPIPVAIAVGWVDYFVADGDLALLFDATLALSSVSLPAAIAIAIVRHGLFDIRLVLSRVLTSVVLGTFVTVLYGFSWSLASARGIADGLSGLVTVVVVALIAHPISVAVHRRLERWVFGYRSAPYLAMQRVAAQAADGGSDDLLNAVLRSVADVVGADRARLEMGQPGGDAVRVELIAAGHHVGVLAVETRGGATDPIDETLLTDLARYVALVVRSEQLNQELSASRDRLIEARVEERRRLHRELHDGLGPTLAAIGLKVDVARGTRNHSDRDAILAEVRRDASGAMEEVRRVVEGLRPVVLEYAGLIDALRARARSLSTNGMMVSVHGSEPSPRVPPAIESAAYLIASEAMANAAKHSGARHCRVEVIAGSDLAITIQDDGQGLTECPRAGSGWHTMVERAEELGGTCSLGPGERSGVAVRASLPLHGR